MKVSVLVKCPHDVRAEIQDVEQVVPSTDSSSSFSVPNVVVSFDCDICKGYHQGYQEAKADGIGTRTTHNPVQRILSGDSPPVHDSRIAGSV